MWVMDLSRRVNLGYSEGVFSRKGFWNDGESGL